MRGGSEGGITPGLAAVANAIVDALAEFGVEHIELPAAPERVWNAIRHSQYEFLLLRDGDAIHIGKRRREVAIRVWPSACVPARRTNSKRDPTSSRSPTSLNTSMR